MVSPIVVAGGEGKGFISVGGINGITDKAGILLNNSNQGAVFRDFKHFQMVQPKLPNKQIWYASLADPEAGAYDRGMANLENGMAIVTLSGHFQEVINTSVFGSKTPRCKLLL